MLVTVFSAGAGRQAHSRRRQQQRPRRRRRQHLWRRRWQHAGQYLWRQRRQRPRRWQKLETWSSFQRSTSATDSGAAATPRRCPAIGSRLRACGTPTCAKLANARVQGGRAASRSKTRRAPAHAAMAATAVFHRGVRRAPWSSALMCGHQAHARTAYLWLTAGFL